MGLEKVSGLIEREPLPEWLDKKALIGLETTFTISSVQKLEDDLVLELYPNGSKNIKLMRLPLRMKNELIDHFGNNVNAWEGMDITIRFDKFTPREGSKASEGAKTTLVWTETVHMN